ncbi:Calx-beta domain-containing protein [Lysobacter yananisis]|uniref:Calx-beta domain-containing protein n=1 Tax=Lysobacter yananisis TaxID=1003114 RepID=A0ABY9PE58_9GAMM|nr:Calx-beta domain-containing protein [Lysobacter yananisis]WMT04693.1 Calx-beta domain-containing protein [Lysobacter yananisis]
MQSCHDPAVVPPRRCARALLAAALAAASFAAPAQVQRTFVNLGFETPNMVTAACVGFYVGPQQVTGWNTTETNRTAGGCGVTANPATGPVLELWNNGALGVTARTGKQHAELNAYTASRVYQNVCMTNGEVINWRLSHRGRDSATVPDVMDFGINATGSTSSAITTQVARIGTTNNGTDRINAAGAAQPSFASLGTLTIGGTTGGWRDYSGTFTYTGTTGVQQLGFAAVSSALGNISSGNFLDEIQVTLTPYLEFDPTSYTVREGTAGTLPQIRVIGTVPAGGITVPIQITGGTATVGSDYTVDNGTATQVDVAIPAGTYDNRTFPIPITVVDDNVIEDNETVTFTVQPVPGSFTLTSTSTCSAAAQASATLTILDNDVDLATTKTVGNAAPTPGTNTQFTVDFLNNTSRPTVADTTAHDASVNLADAVPAGLTFASWTCVGTGATCPASSGTGAISGIATLPAGAAGSAGGRLTYTITATLGAGQCAAIANTATISARAPVAEGASAQAGFNTPAPGGTANNSASASVDAVCAALSLRKSDNATTYTPGGSATYVLTACNAGPDAANGATISDTLPNGVRLGAGWSCGGSGAVPGTCPAGGGVAGDNSLSVAGVNLPANGCVAVSVPVNFSANPADY